MKISGIALATMALGFAGCDSDDEEGSTPTPTDTVTGDDTTTGSDTTTGGEDTTTGEDTMTGEDGGPDPDTTTGMDTDEPDVPEMDVPMDPCDPNPCTDLPANCDGDGNYAEYEGVCTDNEGSAECAYEVIDGTAETCGEGQQCDANQGCFDVADSFEIPAGASVISALAIGGDGEEGNEAECCFDFDGDSEVDNALGALVSSLGGILGADADVNALVQEQLDEGGIAIALGYDGGYDGANDATITMAGYISEHAEGNFVEGLIDWSKADLQVAVDPASFIEGTFNPLISFADAEIASGTLTAGPAVFTLSVPISDTIVLTLSISNTTIEAPVEVGANGEGLDSTEARAKLGGYVLLADVAAALNGFVDGSCECLGLEDGLVFLTSPGSASCNKADNNTCDDAVDGEDICNLLDSFCSAALLFIKPDISSNDDGVLDAISIGAWVEMVSVEITGVVGAEAPM